ncbi:MAG: MFS transporter [Alphaproteobacteria bacterium]
MLTVQSLVTMALFSVPVFAVVAAIDLGVPARWIGGYISLVYITAMASSGMGGLFALRFGAIRMCQACLAIAAISLCLTATGWLPLFMLGALVMGIAYGPPTPASSHILSRYTPPRLMPVVFSVKQTGVPLGGALAGAIIPVLVLAQGWRAASLYIAAACLVAMVALQPLRARFDADRDPGQRLRGNLLTPFRQVMADAVLRRFAFMSFLYSSVQMSLVTYFVTYLVEDVTLDLVTAGMVLAAAQTAGIFGRILWGSLSGLVLTARRILALLGLSMAAAAVVTALFEPGWPLAALIAVSVLFGATAIGWNGVFLAEFARLAPPGQAGLVTGGSMVVTFAGVVVAPPVFGVLVMATGGYGASFILLAVLGVAGMVLLAGIPERPGGTGG